MFYQYTDRPINEDRTKPVCRNLRKTPVRLTLFVISVGLVRSWSLLEYLISYIYIVLYSPVWLRT